MLTVKPAQTKEEQKALCEAVGITYRPEAFLYVLRVEETLTGLAQFRITKEGGIIDNLAKAPGTDDAEAMVIMSRATMSFLYRCGVTDAYLGEGACDDVFAHALDFRKNENGVWHIDLKKFYSSPCHYQAD